MERDVGNPLLIPNGEIHLKIPYPPSINHYYGRNKHTGGLFIKKEGVIHRQETQRIVCEYYARNGFVPLDIPLIKKHHRISMEIQMIVPDKRIRDTDNIKKCLKDSLVHAHLIEDDYSVNRENIIRYVNPIKPGFILVTIRPSEEVEYAEVDSGTC